jgi:hypothetical protein
VTVGGWIVSRTPEAPPALTTRVLEILDRDAALPASGTPERCLAAAAKALNALLTEERFGRSDARTLLAIDALTTYAFEYASQNWNDADHLAMQAREGAQLLGSVTSSRD